MNKYCVTYREGGSSDATIYNKELTFSYITDTTAIVKFFDDEDNLVFALPVYTFLSAEKI